ncbi:MAG: hypothetical protein HC850_13960 [Rhodomicrobium sp.]|nr:hypothetical protein [Rhodomicrobium sp.]
MRSFDYEAQAESGALIGCDRVRRAQDGFREAGLRPTVIKLIELGLERVQSFDNAGGDVIMQLEGDGAATDLGVLLKDVAVAVPASLASRLTEFLAAQSGQPEQACHTRPLQRDRRNETMLRRLPGSETAGLQTFFLESALTFLIAAVLEDVRRERERARRAVPHSGRNGSSALWTISTPI